MVGGEKQMYARNLALVPESPLDFTIQVNRGPLRYPDWVQGLRHAEFHSAGPVEYDLSTDVVEWLEDRQKTGVLKGGGVYESLIRVNFLERSLGFVDLLAIQAKGLPVFRALWPGKILPAWRSMARDQRGCWRIPCLEEEREELIMKSASLRHEFGANHPALLFR